MVIVRFVVVLISVILLRVASETPSVQVHLNGTPLAEGVLVEDEVFVPVAALAHAVDGPAASTRSRIRALGRELYAVTAGGCRDCAVRVRRAVLISREVRSIGAEPCFPLADLVRAFEGRLAADAAAGVYTIYAGACSWCVLEPQASEN